MSKGSLAELDTQVVIAHELGYIDKTQLGDIKVKIDGLQRMIYSHSDKFGHSKKFD